MTEITEWNDLSLQRRINVFPDRHPYVMKCLLYLAFIVTPVSWEAIYKVAETMGYIPVTVEQDLGGGMTLATKGWTRP